MSNNEPIPLLFGEIYVDYTLTRHGEENKLRLGGIAHAARGFWALAKPFSVAAVLPTYLEELARRYLKCLGCVHFHVIGRVSGAPNVMAIHDPTEVADQAYEDLLREEKQIEHFALDLSGEGYRDVLIFPGGYDLLAVCAKLPRTARLHVDVGYDINDPGVLADVSQRIETILISTSSALFKSLTANGVSLAEAFSACKPARLILKENRGGTRMFSGDSSSVEALPAQLGLTINSVGVGDVFAATYVAHLKNGHIEAGWRATYGAAAYSQTTDPDLFKTYVQRDLKLSLSEMQQLWGTFLPWEDRQQYPIYLAAPDFSHGDRRAVDRVIESLGYHNFLVRRPVLENKELPPCSSPTALQQTYQADYQLLKQCALLFAVPTRRDPGTLVEVGIAIEAGIPVVVYDSDRENANTMVMAGAQHYSPDLDGCLNAVFRILSGRRPR